MLTIRPFLAGSSPPARGTHVRRARRQDQDRFIPARAGNTSGLWAYIHRWTVHPRPRGEHGLAGKDNATDIGSSPPARGTPRLTSRAVSIGRFIPARAGNTDDGAPPRGATSVHPRPRGEHPTSVDISIRTFGSSPPARGTLLEVQIVGLGHRFIHARAGNTTESERIVAICSVHPRPRGEHVIRPDEDYIYTGSSPPARGTPSETNGVVTLNRFIPARAGNTPTR